MTIRLNKVTRDLNVGITTVVEFLQKKGYAIEASPNAKITEEQYAELVKEFSKDKNLKKETEKLMQERQGKQPAKNDAPVARAAEEKKQEEVDLRPNLKLTPVGKIDLECYDYRSGTDAEIRATEQTVLSRIPPRVEIRKNAPLEMPHVMLLIDDMDCDIIECNEKITDTFEKVYEKGLNMEMKF